LKIGSYIRVQTSWNAEGGGVPLGANDAATETAGRQTRTDTSNLAMRVRASVSVDLRTQTEYGTLRSYLEIGQQLTTNNSNAVDSPFFDRGFIQFAGFTAGKIRSYFDINSFAPYSYANSRVSGDTGAAGIYGIAYTAQFGNGVTASLSFEDGGSGANGNNTGSTGARGHLTQNLSTTVFAAGANTLTYDNRGWTYPDVVGALRIDQAWGYAQVAAALHDASGGYYTSGGVNACGSNVNCVTLGHPGTATGWAVTGGFTLNNVLGLKGDQFGMQAAYSQGAAGYVTRVSSPMQIWDSNTNVGVGWLSDAVFDNTGLAAGGSSLQLTTVWGVNGFYQHFWNPRWRTSLHGGYVAVDYGGAATSIINSRLAGGVCATSVGTSTFSAITPGAGNACSPDSSWWVVGTRTQWNPHPDLDIGLEVMWTHLNTAYKGAASFASSGARPACSGAGCVLDDQDDLSVYFRIQRNFLP
jgi:hypothetical protein